MAKQLLEEGLWRIGQRAYMIELDFLERVQRPNSNSVEELYYCPSCPHEGEPNSKSTMYFNTIKLQGYCQRCHSKFLLYSDKSDDAIELEMQIRRFNHAGTDHQVINLKRLPEFNYDKMFEAPSQATLDYLTSRNPLLAGMEDVFQFREMPGMGIAVPIWFKDKIVSYSLRYLEPQGKMKYYIPTGNKYVYSPNNALRRGSDFSEITLVEGYFDAIGALLDGYPNPISVQGSYLTPVQARMIGQFFPDKVYCYLDKSKLSYQLLMSARNQLKTVSKFEVVHSNGDDPEEIFIGNLAGGEEKYLNDVMNTRELLLSNVK